MSTIGESHVRKAAEHVEHLFRDYLSAIDEAYLESENDISIIFTVKISPHPTMTNEEKVKTSIRFTPKATTDKIEEACSEHQERLNFHQEASIETPDESGAVKGFKENELEEPSDVLDVSGRPRPNENGVIDALPIFEFSTKKSQASITIFPWEGMWLQASHADIKGASGYGHPVSINHEQFSTAEDALDFAKQDLISHCERTIQDYPGKRSEIKKIIVWAENLTAAGIDVKTETKQAMTSAEDLEQLVELLAKKMTAEAVDAETAGEWFKEVAGRVIATWFPGFLYVTPREILTWLDECAANEGAPVLNDLKEIMASMEGYKQVIFRYIDVYGLLPVYQDPEPGSSDDQTEGSPT